MKVFWLTMENMENILIKHVQKTILVKLIAEL